MGCTHGRTYARLIKGGRGEDATSTARLLFGMGFFNNPANLGTVPLATSTYRCSPMFERIAADLDEPRLFKERHSIEIADAPQYGLAFDNLEDGHLYWSIQDYTHDSIYDLAQEMRRQFGIMLYEDYLQRYYPVWNWQVEQYGKIVDRSIDCHGMIEVHIQTYRPGKPGYQQHPWQATLGIDAVIFTNHPGSDDQRARPNYWAGNGILPRVAQHENVLLRFRLFLNSAQNRCGMWVRLLHENKYPKVPGTSRALTPGSKCTNSQGEKVPGTLIGHFIL